MGLCLSRKRDEVVRIGKDIVVTVRRVHGDRVQLDFDAPRDVSIVRGELDELPPPPRPVAA